MLLQLTDWLVFGVFSLKPGTHMAGMVHFFIYDTVKITLLLFAMITVVGVLRSFLPQEKVKHWLAEKGFLSYFYASGFGAVTPFCSCSSIPVFLGFLKAGAPLGVTFAFLATSPIINQYLVVLMLGFFGWKITLVYVFAGVLAGATAGCLIDRLKLTRYLEEDIVAGQDRSASQDFPSFGSRLRFGLNEAVDIIRKIWLWILVGIGIGAVIHNYVPREAIQNLVAATGIFAVPLAVLLGVPMYGSCAAIVPVAVVLFQKGMPLGTAMAFMMATAALSLPEAILLRRAMRLPLIMIFFGIIAVYMILIGYLLNVLQPFFV
ncbi:MAG: permease [Candidatus Omnitrophota bacterium]